MSDGVAVCKPQLYGEDVVELHVHGSIAVVQAVLRELAQLKIYATRTQASLRVER